MFLSNMILFSFMYLISFHLVMNGDDWFLIWLGLEINMMIFMILMYQGDNVVSMESCMKYFFIQSLGSAVFMGVFYLDKSFLDFLLCMLLSYKMGAGPFFFWFPSLCSNISWLSCFILMIFQKILPLMLLSMFLSWVLYYIVITSLVFGVFGSFNQTNLKQLIAYSSVYHLGWMILCLLSGDVFWLNYLLIYMFVIFPVMSLFMWLGFESLIEVNKMKYKSWFIIMMLSMSGMPPFLGFFLKWFAFIMILNCNVFFMMFLIISSVIMFYVYFRVIFDSLMIFYDKMLWSNMLMMSKGSFYLDFFSGMGLFLGVMLMIFIFF